MLNCCFNITDQIVYIPVDMINLCPYQPRRVFDTSKLMNLAQSIRRYGILQPVSVRFISEGHYELAAGERRLKAAKIAGLEVIPSVVVNIRDKDAAALTLIENIQREGLNIFEEASGIERLTGIFGYVLEEICRMLGVGKEFVEDRLLISKLSTEVRERLIGLEHTEEYAMLITELEDKELRLKAAEEIVKFSLDTKNAARYINKLKKDPEAAVTEDILKPRIKKYFKDIRIFTNTIKRAVEIMNNSGIETAYDIVKKEGKYEISIKVKGE
ncbi:MAG: ParB/RepB/Spo0J family partition protein [Clostridiales bacterium]|nr:ParB/RepB/Spo0J family partition protein [Clostridiales bacterium]